MGIIRLTREITFNNKVQPACLPYSKPQRYPTASTNSWAAGWGSLSFGGQASDVLRNVKILIYEGSSSNLFIKAGLLEGGKDTCQGDSGGPLFVKDTVDGVQKYVIAGITSNGPGCGERNTLG